MKNYVHYKNETDNVLIGRKGRVIRPLDDFWTLDYEDPALGLTMLEDNTPSVVRDESCEIVVTEMLQQVHIPFPKRDPFSIEVTVQAVTSGARIDLRFNRQDDKTAPVDQYTSYCERVDTRRVYCLWLSGTGTARVIFKEVLSHG